MLDLRYKAQQMRKEKTHPKTLRIWLSLSSHCPCQRDISLLKNANGRARGWQRKKEGHGMSSTADFIWDSESQHPKAWKFDLAALLLHYCSHSNRDSKMQHGCASLSLQLLLTTMAATRDLILSFLSSIPTFPQYFSPLHLEKHSLLLTTHTCTLIPIFSHLPCTSLSHEQRYRFDSIELPLIIHLILKSLWTLVSHHLVISLSRMSFWLVRFFISFF